MSDRPEGTADVAEALRLALSAADRMGLCTYDPHDFKGHPLLLWTYRRRSLPRRLVRTAWYGLGFFAPVTLRRLLGVQPRISAGGVALYASACHAVAQLTGEDRWLKKARGLLEWLAAHPAPSQAGLAWGLPFAWSSVRLFPAETPNAHTSMLGTRAFVEHYEATGDAWALELAVRGGEFLSRGLNRSDVPGREAYLSITHMDRCPVINMNAEVAALLLRLHHHHPDDGLRDLALDVLDLVIRDQNEDGGWFYYSPQDGGRRKVIDNLHSGMVLTALVDLERRLAVGPLRSRCGAALYRGADFFMDRLIFEDRRARPDPIRKHPMDVYDCGQSILTLVRLAGCDALPAELRGRASAVAERVAQATVELLMNRDGSFDYRKYPLGTIRLRSLRWGQAIACQALAELLRLRGGAALPEVDALASPGAASC